MRESTFSPLSATEDTIFRPVQLYIRQFLEGGSAKFATPSNTSNTKGSLYWGCAAPNKPATLLLIRNGAGVQHLLSSASLREENARYVGKQV